MGEGIVLSLYDTNPRRRKPTYFPLRVIEIDVRERMIKGFDRELNVCQRKENMSIKFGPKFECLGPKLLREGVAYTRLTAWNELRYIAVNICLGVGNCSVRRKDAHIRAWHCNRISLRKVAHGMCAKISECVCSIFVSDGMFKKFVYGQLADDQMYAFFAGCECLLNLN